MTFEFANFTFIDWILAALLVLIAFSTSCAAWYGAVISRKNQKRLERRESVVLRASADHYEIVRTNTTRHIDDERVTIRVFNNGRPLQIDSVFLRPKGLDRFPSSFGNFYNRFPSDRSFDLPTHKTVILSIKVSEILELKNLVAEKKPIRVRLTDGAVVDLGCKELHKILAKLRAFQSDLNNGVELLLPDIYIWVGNGGKIAQAWEGAIPDEAQFKIGGTPPNSGETISSEDEAVWRTGGDPQLQKINAARAKKR